MRRVRHKLRKGVHRGFEPGEHGVQDFGQAGDFVARCGDRQPLGQILDADGERGGGDIVDRL
jgi:hypothetical protein